MRHTIPQIRELLARLDGEPADALESETLECKSWDPVRRGRSDLMREVREAVVALANQRGGAVVLGVEDRKRSRREALTGVGDLAVGDLRKAIYDGTDPHILVEVEELVEPEARLLVLHVPKGLGVHTTADGLARIRVGKDSLPLTGSMIASRVALTGDLDRTALPAVGAGFGDLDDEEVQRFRRIVSDDGRRADLVRSPLPDLLANLGLTRDGELTFAAILLMGKAPAIARFAPQHEIVFTRYTSATRYDAPYNLRGPLLSVMDALQRLFEASLRVSVVQTMGFEELALPDVTWTVAREALLNAVVHRDYFLNQSIHVEIRPGRIEVASPGGFIGGVTAENILRHKPARRNPLLADAFETLGWVNRRGMGVDRMLEESLRLGKGMPRYDADEASVRLAIPTATSHPFARLVALETRAGRPLELDDLIVLRSLAERGEIERWAAAKALQASEEDAAERLASLRERGFLTPRGRGRGTTYRLARAYSDLLLGRLATDEALDLDGEAVRLRLQAVLRERGTLTNTDVRRISGYSRTEALRLMQEMREADLVVLVGRGRSAHYVPGPALPQGPREGSGRTRGRT